MQTQYEIISLGCLLDGYGGWEINDAHTTGMSVEAIDLREATRKARIEISSTRGVTRLREINRHDESRVYLGFSGRPFFMIQEVR